MRICGIYRFWMENKTVVAHPFPVSQTHNFAIIICWVLGQTPRVHSCALRGRDRNNDGARGGGNISAIRRISSALCKASAYSLSVTDTRRRRRRRNSSEPWWWSVCKQNEENTSKRSVSRCVHVADRCTERATGVAIRSTIFVYIPSEFSPPF